MVLLHSLLAKTPRWHIIGFELCKKVPSLFSVSTDYYKSRNSYKVVIRIFSSDTLEFGFKIYFTTEMSLKIYLFSYLSLLSYQCILPPPVACPTCLGSFKIAQMNLCQWHILSSQTGYCSFWHSLVRHWWGRLNFLDWRCWIPPTFELF